MALQLAMLGQYQRLRAKGMGQRGGMARQHAGQVFLDQQRRRDLLADGGGGGQVRALGAAVEYLRGRRQYLRQHIASHAHRIRHMAGAAVVAGQHAPQAVVDQDRNAHRRGHAHVLQVFDVHRRHAAQHAVAHVERGTGGAAEHGYRCIVHVGNQPHRVDDVQTPCLCRDVAGRIALPQVGRPAVKTRFGHHFAAVIRAKAVSHDAVETGHGAHLFDGELQQGGDVFLALQAVIHLLRHQYLPRDLRRRLDAALELQQHPPQVGMHDAIDAQAIDMQRGHHRRRFAFAHFLQAVLYQRCRFGRHSQRGMRQARRQRHAQLQQAGGIAGPACQQSVGIEHQQRAMGLDLARQMDRFVGAIGQRDWHAGRSCGG